jgi:prepilin-type N-terminal cleavage/methylation domain-containing protein
MRKNGKGFTIVEILTVLAIVALLVGVLLPALNMARNAARVAKQKVQLVSIEQALLAFRNDDGDYPPSNIAFISNIYGGAQKLAEAMVGFDLLGFHPSSKWTYDGYDGSTLIYDTGNSANVAARKPRYIELENANAFKIGDIYVKYGYVPMANTYVLCDAFGRTRITVGTKTVTAGMPILYYKANPSGLGLILGKPADSIYNFTDNAALVSVSNVLVGASSDYGLADIDNFISFITDPKVIRPSGAYPWPRRPDSYILISAGIDGLYGTADDITNFGY